jgi:hypothetical protein
LLMYHDFIADKSLTLVNDDNLLRPNFDGSVITPQWSNTLRYSTLKCCNVSNLLLTWRKYFK